MTEPVPVRRPPVVFFPSPWLALRGRQECVRCPIKSTTVSTPHPYGKRDHAWSGRGCRFRSTLWPQSGLQFRWECLRRGIDGKRWLFASRFGGEQFVDSSKNCSQFWGRLSATGWRSQKETAVPPRGTDCLLLQFDGMAVPVKRDNLAGAFVANVNLPR